MLYSGMPIAEQSRYTGTKYLPALAQLESQQNQQKFSLTSALNDLNMKKYAQAQTVRQQELDWNSMILQARARAGGDKGWGDTYKYLRDQLGYDFAPQGSAADEAFHSVFGR